MARKRQPDHFARRAKKEGKAARSVYKLEEIDQRWGVLRKGGGVLDLGCAPGSWLQFAAGRVGSKGRVIGYDLKPLQISLPAHAQARVGDVFELEDGAFEEPFDTVLSDMAPSTMGDHTTDAIRSAGLAEMALALADRLLKRGGSVVIKVLEGGDVPGIVERMRMDYEKVERLRPKATRKSSTELFLIGLRKRAHPSAQHSVTGGSS